METVSAASGIGTTSQTRGKWAPGRVYQTSDRQADLAEMWTSTILPSRVPFKREDRRTTNRANDYPTLINEPPGYI